MQFRDGSQFPGGIAEQYDLHKSGAGRHVPMANIMPSGMCTSMANPAVAAATAAAMGVLTPMPCIPNIPNTPAPWVPGAATVLLGNAPALDNVSKLMCVWGGVIQIVTPGEFTV